MKIMALVWVFIGSGLGGMLRYLMGWGFRQFLPYSFPIGTLVVNVMACSFVGWVVSKNMESSLTQIPVSTILIVGFCGGFSTFSAFGLETWHMVSKGNFTMAVLYVCISLLLGFLAFAVQLKS